MNLRHVTIHNFRAIRDASAEIHDYALLVGANNCGKSTIVDCIRAVYEKDKFKFNGARDFPVGEVDDQESWAELEFELLKDEYEDLAEKYRLPHNRLRLRKVFRSSQSGIEEGVLYGYLVDGKLETSAFYGAKGVQNGKIGDIIYIPAVSTVDEHTKLSGPSALRDLLTDLLSSVVEGSQAYETFNRHYETFVESTREAKNGDARSLAEFEKELDDNLEGWQAGFRLEFRAPAAQDLVKSLLGWELLDEITNKESQPGNFGSGFQRHFIFSLISIGSKYAKQAPKKKGKDFTPSLRLLLFEEPEAFLHPPQQYVLSNELRRLTQNAGWQVLCSTHSPHFVSRRSEEITAMIRLCRDGTKANAYQLSQDRWDELLDARKDLEAIVGGPNGLSDDEKNRLEVLRYFLWLNPERSGLFFAERVLLVEGLSEVALLNRLIDNGELKVKSRDCYILNSEGKYNIHRFMRLLTQLGIPHCVLFDEDGESNNHPKLNDLITSSADSRFTKGFVKIKGNLESYLGMPKPIDRLKPILIIKRYEQGQFDAAMLRRLCDELQKQLV
jgi:putative ATP-dependent endonuclease of the OLD family